MAKIAIKASKIFTENSIEKNAYLLIEEDKILAIISNGDLPSDIKTIDYHNYSILPGLIDTHIHGAVGYDTMDSTKKSLKEIGNYLVSQGTTSWIPTTVTAPLENIYHAIDNVAKHKNISSSRILGMFIEGPYITAKHKGAHPENCIGNLNRAEIDKMAEKNIVKAMIIAPEKAKAPEFTKYLTAKLNIKVSLGHSSANFEEACACFDAGADALVHTFCGMEQFHHRKPNLLGAGLTCDDIFTELIADGIHVSVPAMKILLACKPKDKVILISDAIRATGLKDGRYMLGILPFNVKNGIARIDSGNIAGSTTTLLKEVKLFIEKLKVNPVDAINMASLNPAKRYHLDDSIGSIKAGKQADFIIVDEDFKVTETFVSGKSVFLKKV